MKQESRPVWKINSKGGGCAHNDAGHTGLGHRRALVASFGEEALESEEVVWVERNESHASNMRTSLITTD